MKKRKINLHDGIDKNQNKNVILYSSSLFSPKPKDKNKFQNAKNEV